MHASKLRNLRLDSHLLVSRCPVIHLEILVVRLLLLSEVQCVLLPTIALHFTHLESVVIVRVI